MLYDDSYIIRGIRGDYTAEAETLRRPNPGELALLYLVKGGMACVFAVIYLICHIPLLSAWYETLARTYSRGALGFFLRGAYYKTRLKRMGKNVFIDLGVTIWEPGNVEIDDGAHVDTYVTILGGSKGKGYVRIGKYVHVVSNCVLSGRGGISLGDYSGVAAGAKIYSATNTYRTEAGKDAVLLSMSALAPDDMQRVIEAPVTVGDYAFVGANSVVLPGVTLGKAAVVGSGSVVTGDIPPFTIAAGSPARIIKQRPQPRR